MEPINGWKGRMGKTKHSQLRGRGVGNMSGGCYGDDATAVRGGEVWFFLPVIVYLCLREAEFPAPPEASNRETRLTRQGGSPG